MLKHFFNLKLKYKLLISYLFIILSLALAYYLIFEQLIVDTIEKNIISSTNNLLTITGDEVSSCIQTVEDIGKFFILHTEMQQVLSKEPNTTSMNEQISDFHFVENNLKLFQDYNNISHISLMINEDFIYANNRINFYPFSNDISNLTPYEQKVIQSNGKVVWCSPFIRTDITGYHESVISAGRMLRSYHDFSKTIGAVFIYITEDTMSSILSNASFYENSLFLFSGEGELICQYSPDTDAIQNALGNTAISADTLPTTLEKDYIVTSVTINNSGWKLISALPNLIIQQDIQSLRQKILTITMSILLTSLSFSLLFSHMHTKRIEKITRHIQEESFTKLPLSKETYNDEISTLEQHFNILIDKIDSLLKEQFELGRKIEKTQYTLLCAQINPHFLYNTLDFINLLSIKKEIPEISKMIRNLARFYKLSLNRGESNITLAEEIEHITVYLDIQNQRFSKPVQFNNLISTNFYDLILPNLILQPIVENAILHGIYNSAQEIGMINLSAEQKEDSFIITIEDNGIGCDIDILTQRLTQSSQDQKGYGLRNVHQRIQLSYGTAYGLSFDKSNLGGLKVMITLASLYSENTFSINH